MSFGGGRQYDADPESPVEQPRPLKSAMKGGRSNTPAKKEKALELDDVIDPFSPATAGGMDAAAQLYGPWVSAAMAPRRYRH